MGHERNIEAMRDARRNLPPDGVRRADRHRRRRRSRGRRLLRAMLLLVFLAAAAVVIVVVVANLTGGDKGGGFAGTWEKSGPGTRLVIEEVGDDAYTIAVTPVGMNGVGGGDDASPAAPRRVSKATLDGDTLTAENMLGVSGLTVTFTLDDDGAVLVETFPNGSQDRLQRVD